MKNSKLNRDTNSRIALFRSQISAMIEKEEILTTAGKAKVIKSLFEKMLSKAKAGTIHARREIQSVLVHNSLVQKMVNEIAPRYKDIRGGYTKVTMVGARKGDGAMIVKLALTKKAQVGVSPRSSKSEAGKKAEAPKATAPKVAAPKVARATKTAKISVNKAAMVRKTGER